MKNLVYCTIHLLTFSQPLFENQNKRYIGTYTYKGKEIPGGMPRIVSDNLFYKVQEIMTKNSKAPARSKAKQDYLLTTKLFCGYCREMMRGYGGTGKQIVYLIEKH